MPSRAIRLGVVVQRSIAAIALRAAIWLTHEEINLAAAEFEALLLYMRGRCYEIRVKTTAQFCAGSPEDFVLVDEKTVRRDAMRFFRAAQKRNGGKGGKDAEIRGLMRGLYEAIIPSAALGEDGEPEKGTAQASCAFIRNLTLAGSEGNMNCVPIAQAVPAWLTDYRAWCERTKTAKTAKTAKKKEKKKKKRTTAEKPAAPAAPTAPTIAPAIPQSIQTDATAWLATSQCRDVHMKLSGACPEWIKLVKGKAKPETWIPHHAKWHKKQVKRAVTAAIIARLLDLGLLPLLDRDRISRQLQPDGLSGWALIAFKGACAHLLG